MAEFRITQPPRADNRLTFREGTKPRYLLTVDTEEEFDWAAPLAREGFRLDSVGELANFQQFAEGFGAKPVYLLDYPLATSAQAMAAIGDAVAGGRAEVGVQLHPWVSPPFDEQITEYNSFAGNLPYDLERAKLLELHAAITRNFGQAPNIYRAGRYGVGPNTAFILREAGITIDTSVRAGFDYTGIGGQNFAHLGPKPWWVSEPGQLPLIELPLTTVFCGALRRHAARIYPMLGKIPRGPGLFARSHLLDRIPLTPEGVSIAEAIRAIDQALADGLPVLVLSFHSPSLSAGCTPYVRDQADLEAFYAWWRAILAHLAARGVEAASTRDIIASLSLASGPGAG